MIPIRDNIPSKTLPIINYLLIALNTYIFILEVKSGSGITLILNQYAFYPNELMLLISGKLETLSPLKKMFTSMFLHGGFGHFLGNMLFLYIFGDNVEDRLGHIKYLIFYLFCGIAAILLHYWFNKFSSVPTLGASGAIAGVMGAYFIFFPYAKVLTIIPIFIFIQFVEIPAFFFLILWFLLQFYLGTISQMLGAGSVAWWAHVGGFVAGAVIAITTTLLFKIKRLY